MPLIWSLLLFDILFDKGDRCSTAGAREITWGPEHALPVVSMQLRMLFAKKPGGNPFQAVDQFRDGDLGRVIDQQMHMGAFASNSTSLASKSRQTSINSLLLESRVFFVNTGRRHFATNTRWTCRAKTQWLPF